MKKNTIIMTKNALTILVGFIFVLSSCKKDKDLQVNLTLAKTEAEVFVDESVTVEISAGNGGYTATSSSDAVATATVSGATVTIEGITKGSATITLKDQAGRSAVIAVTVKNAIVDPNTARFKWDNTIELDMANGWSTTILANSFALTSLADKKQFVLSWTGGYTVGDKTDAKLRILESGKQAQEVSLTVFEVQKADNNRYSVTFSNAEKKGELVFTK